MKGGGEIGDGKAVSRLAVVKNVIDDGTIKIVRQIIKTCRSVASKSAIMFICRMHSVRGTHAIQEESDHSHSLIVSDTAKKCKNESKVH